MNRVRGSKHETGIRSPDNLDPRSSGPQPSTGVVSRQKSTTWWGGLSTKEQSPSLLKGMKGWLGRYVSSTKERYDIGRKIHKASPLKRFVLFLIFLVTKVQSHKDFKTKIHTITVTPSKKGKTRTEEGTKDTGVRKGSKKGEKFFLRWEGSGIVGSSRRPSVGTEKERGECVNLNLSITTKGEQMDRGEKETETTRCWSTGQRTDLSFRRIAAGGGRPI